jgi:hypothetical protein
MSTDNQVLYWAKEPHTKLSREWGATGFYSSYKQSLIINFALAFFSSFLSSIYMSDFMSRFCFKPAHFREQKTIVC